jgi:hypothetical protein
MKDFGIPRIGRRQREVNDNRTIRLASIFLRIAALEDRIVLLARKYSKVPEGDIRKLATLDPTEGKYLEWLVRNYEGIKNYMDNMNNVTMIKGMLVFYDKVKKIPSVLERVGLSPDINKVDISDLVFAWAKYKDTDLASERQKIERAKKFGSSVIYDKNGYKIIKIEGNDENASLAACIYANGTKWCTSNEDKARYYLGRGPLYIVFKNGQKVLQTDLKEWKNPESKEVDITEDDELSKVLVDSGVLSDPEMIIWVLIHKYYLNTPRWPAVEHILAKDPKSAFEYARITKEPFLLGEPAIASDPGIALAYISLGLKGRFPEAEAGLKTRPDYWKVYINYINHLEKSEENTVVSRTLRLAYRFLRRAALEDRIKFYAKTHKIPEEDLRRLAKADPTDGKYLGWLINHMVDPGDYSDLWLDLIRERLAFYQRVSRSKILLNYVGLPVDINQMSMDQLFESWNEHKDEDLSSAAQKDKKIKNTAKIIYSKGPYKILQIGGDGSDPETAIEAVCAYSRGTAWCTRSYDMSKGYIEKGPLFLAFKGKERLFLANWAGNEIKDVSNKPIKFTEEILFILLESGLLRRWADSWNRRGEDRLFDECVYNLNIYPHKYPAFLQRLMSERLVSPRRVMEYIQVTGEGELGETLPSMESYIATDPKASLMYAKYVSSQPFPLGEPAIRSVPKYWKQYQEFLEEESVHV